MTTAAENHELLRETVAALETYYAARAFPEPDNGELPTSVRLEKHYDKDRAVRKLVNRCIEQGIPARLIASTARLAGHLVVGYITDPQDRADAYVDELHYLEQQERTIRSMQAAEARRRHADGERKSHIAESLRVTRPTLDRWIDEQD